MSTQCTLYKNIQGFGICTARCQGPPHSVRPRDVFCGIVDEADPKVRLMHSAIGRALPACCDWRSAVR